jgi:hypothetical protein
MAAIQQALAPIASRLDALERHSMPPLSTQPTPQSYASTINHPPTPSKPLTPTAPAAEAFALVSRTGKNKSNKGRTNTLGPKQINLTPASYTAIAAAAAHTNQPAAPLKQKVTLPLITEIMVIRSGGHIDPHTEQSICTCAADTIIREVCLKMAKAVANPILLKAGHWSINPRSKGILYTPLMAASPSIASHHMNTFS